MLSFCFLSISVTNCYFEDLLIMSGHDTTASAIAWAIFCLGKYPDGQEKIYRETAEVMEDREYIKW